MVKGQQGEQICSLRAQDGSISTRPKEVMYTATDYHRTLFQQASPDPQARHCREEVWSHTPTLIEPSMGEALIAPFTITEMQEAVRDIDGQKCLGEDMLSKAFFTTFWEQIHQPLLAAFKQIFSNEHMPESLALGLICLLPKADKRSDSVAPSPSSPRLTKSSPK